MKKAYVVLAIILVVVGTIYLWLHSIKKPYQAAFSDNYLIVGDGAGPYGVSAQGIFGGEGGGSLSLDTGSRIPPARNVTARFGDAQWVDRAFFDITPEIPSANYILNIQLGFDGRSWADVMSQKVGETYEPEIKIELWTPNPFSYVGTLYRHPSPEAYVPLPPQLLKQGHAYLIREDENKWALDVDAWFMTTRGFEGRTYYVRLTFRLTI